MRRSPAIPKVIRAELVEAQLGQDDDPDHLVLEHHRREEERLVEVVLRARDGLRSAVVHRVRHVLRDPYLATQPVTPWPTLTRSCSMSSPWYSPISPFQATGTQSSRTMR